MEKSERKKFFRLKALKESFIIVSIILILFVLAIKFDNSIFYVLISSIGFKFIIPIIILLLCICYILVYSINYVYIKMDIKVNNNKNNID